MPPTVYFTAESLAKTPRLDFVVHEFPFPLALTYARIWSTVERQEPVEAAWAVRDAYECGIKFCASVAAADYIQAGPAPAVAGPMAQALLNDRGLAIGTWAALLHEALQGGPGQPPGRLIGELWGVFYHGHSKSTPVRKDLSDFAGWRNEVFGHGVFTHDLPWYAAEALRWLEKLHGLLQALRPVFSGWRLQAKTAGGELVDWQGCDFTPKLDRHQHDPVGHGLPMLFVHDDKALSFGPLLSVQHCRDCREPAAFFFDRQKTPSCTILLEYLKGRKGQRDGWDAVDDWKKMLPPDFEWKRQVYDTQEVLPGVPIAFRDFAKEYVRPAYLIDRIRQWIGGNPKGYLLLTGPAGVGKSYVARGLTEREGDLAGRTPVVSYYITPGVSSDYQFFAIDLNTAVKEALGCKTIDLQLKPGRPGPRPELSLPEAIAAMRREVVDYLQKVLHFARGRKDGLVIVLDALDEIPEAEAGTPIITDLLPDANDLPDGCFIILTTREEKKTRVQQRLELLRKQNELLDITLDPRSPENEAVLKEYLQRLPKRFRTPAAIEEIIRRSGGIFLYALHFSQALAQGAFADAGALPLGGQFYPIYLARLRERSGIGLYEQVYLPLLLSLSAAQLPVTREQLERWGLPAERLTVALNDLRDFIRLHRVRFWHECLGDDLEPRYSIAHDDFVRFLQQDADLSLQLRERHLLIAQFALAHSASDWKDIDCADDGDLYDLRFVGKHAELACCTDGMEQLHGDERYPNACGKIGKQLDEKARHHLAVEVAKLAVVGFRHLAKAKGRADLANDLAGALVIEGWALIHLQMLEEALARCDEALCIRRALVQNHDSIELGKGLAVALMAKGATLGSLGRSAEGLEHQDEAIFILRDLVQNQQRGELADYLAASLVNKAISLHRLERWQEALVQVDEGIRILGDLVEIHHRADLVDKLAYALIIKGAALANSGRVEEALEPFDEAIRNLSDLVQNQHRLELANNLAQALVNKGVALKILGRLKSAIELFDQAIEIRRDQVANQQRTELVSDLASVLSYKGEALVRLREFEKAVTEYEKVIGILNDLVEKQHRSELAGVLAGVLENTGVALHCLGRKPVAMQRYNQAISIWDQLANAGASSIVPDLVRGLGFRFKLAVRMRRWRLAASDVLQFQSRTDPIIRAQQVTGSLQEQIDNFMKSLRGLSPQQRQKLYEALGENAEFVRGMIEGSNA